MTLTVGGVLNIILVLKFVSLISMDFEWLVSLSPGLATFFRRDYVLPTSDSNKAVVSYWQKNVNTHRLNPG